MQNRAWWILGIYLAAFIALYLYYGPTGIVLLIDLCAATLTVPLVILLQKRIRQSDEQHEAPPTGFENEFRLAEQFILNRRFNDARKILGTISHPKARELGAKLDEYVARKNPS